MVTAKLKPEEISSIIREKIENFNLEIDISEVGKVTSYADGVAKVYGLNDVMSYEIVEFDTGEKGLALNLEEGSVGVVVLGNGKGIRENTTVKRLKKLMKIPVGEGVIGRVIDTVGEPLDGKGPIESTEYRIYRRRLYRRNPDGLLHDRRQRSGNKRDSTDIQRLRYASVGSNRAADCQSGGRRRILFYDGGCRKNVYCGSFAEFHGCP